MFVRWRREGDSDALEMAGRGSGAQHAAGDDYVWIVKHTNEHCGQIIAILKLDVGHVPFIRDVPRPPLYFIWSSAKRSEPGIPMLKNV